MACFLDDSDSSPDIPAPRPRLGRKKNRRRYGKKLAKKLAIFEDKTEDVKKNESSASRPRQKSRKSRTKYKDDSWITAPLASLENEQTNKRSKRKGKTRKKSLLKQAITNCLGLIQDGNHVLKPACKNDREHDESKKENQVVKEMPEAISERSKELGVPLPAMSDLSKQTAKLKEEEAIARTITEVLDRTETDDILFLQGVISRSDRDQITTFSFPKEWTSQDVTRLDFLCVDLGFEKLNQSSGYRYRVPTSVLDDLILAINNHLSSSRMDQFETKRAPESPIYSGSKFQFVNDSRRRRGRRRHRKSTCFDLATNAMQFVDNDNYLSGSLRLRQSIEDGLDLSMETSLLSPTSFPITLNMQPDPISSSMDSISVISMFQRSNDGNLLRKCLEFATLKFVIKIASTINKFWHSNALHALSLVNISSCPTRVQELKGSASYFSMFSRGSFIAEGGQKRVYQVWNSVRERDEAMAVIDVAELEAIDRDNSEHDKSRQNHELVIGVVREVELGWLLSALTNSCNFCAGTNKNSGGIICPNYIQTYQVIQLPANVPTHLWGTENLVSNTELSSSSASNPQGKFQYMRMELCSEGDMEIFIKSFPGKVLPSALVCELFFQMVFAMYAARHHTALRHYDIKLLNFLVTKNEGSIEYWFGQYRYCLGIKKPTYLVKLADFGTAQFIDTVGCKTTAEVALSSSLPLTRSQFTTFENLPLDALLTGVGCVQDMNFDIWSLGLCLLHMCTGEAPYEEILGSVSCPRSVVTLLRKCWKNKPNTYGVILQIQKEFGRNMRLLEDTVYRLLVLCGTENLKKTWPNLEIAQKLEKALSESSKTKAAVQYREDHACFGIVTGTHPRMKTARNMLSKLAGASGIKLLLSLLAFDPKQRPCLRQLLLDGSNQHIFSSLRTSLSEADINPSFRFYKDIPLSELPEF